MNTLEWCLRYIADDCDTSSDLLLRAANFARMYGEDAIANALLAELANQHRGTAPRFAEHEGILK